MKFSHSIQFNAVPDWASNYIAYSNLKKIIYNLEKDIIGLRGRAGELDDLERQNLLSGTPIDSDAVFERSLDGELEKIVGFYKVKEKELEEDYLLVKSDVENYIKLKTRHESDGSFGPGSTSYNRRNSRSSAGLGLPRRSRSESNVSVDTAGYHDSGDSEDDEHDQDDVMAERDLLSKRRRKSISASPPIDPVHGIRRRPSQSWEEHQEQVYNTLKELRSTLRKRIIIVFVSLRELKSYSQLNKTGFRKALKKYDKILERQLQPQYMEEKVMPAYPFLKGTLANLEAKIQDVIGMYATLFSDDDKQRAERELRLHLREHVIWERNTVWRDMIGIERKAQAAKLGVGRTVLGAEPELEDSRFVGDELHVSLMTEVRTPFGPMRLPKWLLSRDFMVLLGIFAIFGLLLSINFFETPEQNNCFAMLIFVSLLWATEIIPLFVTSLTVPFFVVTLRILRDEVTGERLDAPTASKTIFSAMWTPVIMLLLGGFTIAAALSKYDIAKLMATTVLNKAGTQPRIVLVSNMFVAMFASMWISNVAAPVLCFSLIEPMLRNLPAESKFPKPLIIGIALASNIGGMASPIASPQNIIALQNMNPPPSWVEWFAIALPVSILSILVVWILLLFIYRPHRGTVIVPIRPPKDKFTGTQYFISIVTFATIVLWCVSRQFEQTLGDMGVIALIPMVLFFGTGILTKEDFNNFLWTIIMLAGGGLSLGKAVSSSGLLRVIAESLQHNVEHLSVYLVFVIFCGIVLVIATFISHTVAALIFLPIVARVGEEMSEPHPRLLVMGVALMCSAAMGLPTSGFPNMTAIMLEHPQTGRRYLRVKHFLHTGVPSSFLSYLIVITIGYVITHSLGW